MQLQNYILGFQKDQSGFIEQCFTFLHVPKEHFFSKEDAIEYVQNCGINTPLKQLHTRIPHGFTYKIAVLKRDTANQLYHFVLTNMHEAESGAPAAGAPGMNRNSTSIGENTELLII